MTAKFVWNGHLRPSQCRLMNFPADGSDGWKEPLEPLEPRCSYWEKTHDSHVPKR